MEFVLPPPTEEMLARRAQSDYASAEIGKKLLQGWAMLADECPRSDCYGVPLIRAPGSNLLTKKCVVCKSVYVDAPDGSGLRLLEAQSEPTSSTIVVTPSHNANGLNIGQRSPSVAPPSSSVSANVPRPISATSLLFPPASSTSGWQVPPNPSPSTLSPIQNPTIMALQTAITVLTARLNTLTSSPPPLNVVAIGEASEAISRTLEAIGNAQGLFR